jgi:hypothetical protein
LVERTGGQCQNGLSRWLFRRGEAGAVEFEEQDNDPKARARVAIDEGG